MSWFGPFVAASGLFSLAGATFNWEWFMNHRKARFFVAILGRTGARVFCALLGVGLVVLGVLLACGIVAESR